MPLDAKLARLVLNGFLDPHDAVRKGTDFAMIDPQLLHRGLPGPGGAPKLRLINDGGPE